MYSTLRLLLIFCVTTVMVLPLMSARSQGDDDFEPTFPDVRYVEEGDFKHKVDIYLPEDAESPYTTILLYHGNGYTKWDMEPLAEYFVDQGYAAVAVEYRNPVPEFIEDSLCALAWTHTNAEVYDFDTDNIFVLGHSMGGFAAAVLGVTDDTEPFMADCEHELPEENRVRGVILYAAGAIDASDIENSSRRAQVEALLNDQIDGSEPPFLLIHGLTDSLVSPESSENFAALLDEEDVDATVVLLPDVGHFFTDPTSEAGELAITAVDEFLDEIFAEDSEELESEEDSE